MATPFSSDTLEKLFPTPTAPAKHLAPERLPGTTASTSGTLARLLKDDANRHHIFFNDKNFHNHATHHLYAIYTLGSSSEVLEAAYQSHVKYQRPAFDSPTEVTESNWMVHLGDENYYRAYFKFFSVEVLANGMDATLQKYVFAPSANWVDSIHDSSKQPQMLNRLLSGVLHPFIHLGYAFEFDTPGMFAEGLAMACAQKMTDYDALVPRSLFSEDTLATKLSSVLTLDPKSSGSHSFDIIAEILQDSDLAPGNASYIPDPNGSPFPQTDVMNKRGDLIRKYAEKWVINVNDEATLSSKVEELISSAALLYGVAGLQEGATAFNADFFTAHLINSSLFLPLFAKHISPKALSILLKAYLAISLVVWISRGRPAPQIASFYARTTASLSPPGPTLTPASDTLLGADSATVAPNPWFPLLQSTIVHPDEHLPKLQRALAEFSRLYGTKAAGKLAEAETATRLKDVDKLDGTVFIRIAGLTMERLGWMREGKPRRIWDRTGFWTQS